MKPKKFSFVIDPKYDINWVKNLVKNYKKWDSRIGNSDILGRAVSGIPNLNNLKEVNKKEVNSTIKKEVLTKYNELSEELNKSKTEIENEWRKIEDNYFAEVRKLFDNQEWPEGSFKAVLSILGSFPYDLDENLVHFPYKELNTYSRMGVIIHESLHLMFFNFCKNKIKKKINKKILWDLSEIINPIIQNREPFLSMTKTYSYPYPAHSEQFLYLDTVFDKRKSMQQFIEDAIAYLEKFEKENLPYEERIKLEKSPILIEFKLIENSKILFKFDKDMANGFCLMASENILDLSKAKWEDRKTLIVPLINFDKNKSYRILLNEKNNMYFRSFTGKVLETIEIKIN